MTKDSLSERLAFLKTGVDEQLKLGPKILQAQDGAIYQVDFLAIAVLHRSMALIRGFCLLIEEKNFTCAAPLIRLQLDNLLRFYAAFIVADPHDFAHQVLRGEQIRKMRDRSGKKLTDAHLVKMMSSEYDWIKRVYEHTSGYIHLSSKHMFNTIGDTSETERTARFSIGTTDQYITDAIRFEAVEAMISITNALMRYLMGWAVTKDNPNVIQKMKRGSQQDKISATGKPRP